MDSSCDCMILEAESLHGFPNGEIDLGGIGVDDSFSYAKEWSSQNDGCSIISSCFYHHEVYSWSLGIMLTLAPKS
jgi:hypothetical protein